MKRIAIMIAMLGISAGSFGQGSSAPASGAGQTAAAAPQGKRPPQAKTQAEFAAYNAAKDLTDPAAREKAADDFATKFPDSELRPVLYTSAMNGYQQANNGEKMMDMANKVLKYDPDNPEALLGVAQVLAERTRDTDLDKDERLAEAKKDAQHALATIDTDIPSAGAPPDKLEAYKSFLRSEAYAVLGTISFNAKAWPDAETNLHKSIDAFPSQPDAIAVFRLAVALDMQGKYPDATKYCNQAVELTKEGTPAGDAARQERDRLAKLTGGGAPAPAPTPTPTQPK